MPGPIPLAMQDQNPKLNVWHSVHVNVLFSLGEIGYFLTHITHRGMGSSAVDLIHVYCEILGNHFYDTLTLPKNFFNLFEEC